MADCVDAPVKGMQTSSVQAAFDRLRPEPKLLELVPGDDAVLAIGKREHTPLAFRAPPPRPTHWLRVRFGSHMDPKLTRKRSLPGGASSDAGKAAPWGRC